jgi:hypothetical protein
LAAKKKQLYLHQRIRTRYLPKDAVSISLSMGGESPPSLPWQFLSKPCTQPCLWFERIGSTMKRLGRTSSVYN